MAQDITIAGASFQAVPSIVVPKTGSGSASFFDVSGTTATAEDVAQGKLFYAADGTLTTGTATGGGVEIVETQDSHGGTIIEITGTQSIGKVKEHVLRPDAELVQTWTRDFRVVEDEGITLPAYSTTATTLIASTNIDTYDGSPTEYHYLIAERMLTIPEYNITTKAKGRGEYCATSALYEWLYNPANEIKSLDGSKSYGQYSQMAAYGAFTRYVYWSSATAVAPYTSNAYGAAQGVTAPAVASNKTITIKSPTVTLRGHTTYFTSTYYNALTDIRCQYIIELWRVPVETGSVIGWQHGSQIKTMIDDAVSGGILT